MTWHTYTFLIFTGILFNYIRYNLKVSYEEICINLRTYKIYLNGNENVNFLLNTKLFIRRLSLVSYTFKNTGESEKCWIKG